MKTLAVISISLLIFSCELLGLESDPEDPLIGTWQNVYDELNEDGMGGTRITETITVLWTTLTYEENVEFYSLSTTSSDNQTTNDGECINAGTSRIYTIEGYTWSNLGEDFTNLTQTYIYLLKNLNVGNFYHTRMKMTLTLT